MKNHFKWKKLEIVNPMLPVFFLKQKVIEEKNVSDFLWVLVLTVKIRFVLTYSVIFNFLKNYLFTIPWKP